MQERAIGRRTQSSCWNSSTRGEYTSVFIETASPVFLAALWPYFCLLQRPETALRSRWDSHWDLPAPAPVPRSSTGCPCHVSPLSTFSSALLRQLLVVEAADRRGGEGITAGNNACSTPSLLATLCFNQTHSVWRDPSPANSLPRARVEEQLWDLETCGFRLFALQSQAPAPQEH